MLLKVPDLILGTLDDEVANAIGAVEHSKITVPERSRARHHHIIGANGSGKSRFMQSMIRQDIRAGRGVCLIDPHGTACDDVVSWLAQNPRIAKHRKIRVFNIGQNEQTYSFNPLALKDLREAQPTAARIADAIGRLFSKEDLREQPRTLEVIFMLFITLAENNLTLADYPLLFDPIHAERRKYLVSQLKNTKTAAQWSMLNSYSESDFIEYVSPVARRLYTLLSSPIIEKSFGLTENCIEFSNAMDEGEILLFNLADTKYFDPISAQLFGLLTITSLFSQSKLRNNTKPFYLYIDEAHRYLAGSSLAQIFEECRKYGLHIILLHQNLGQLRDAGERVFSTVMNEAEIKTIFKIKEPDDAAYLARTVFGSQIDPELVKEVLSKPTVVGYTIQTLQSYSESETTGSAKGENSSNSLGISALPDSGSLLNASEVELRKITGESDTQSKTSNKSTSTLHAQSQTLRPELEERASSTWTIEEQVHVLGNQISSLNQAVGIMAVGGNEAMQFKSMDVPDLNVPSLIKAPFLEKIEAENPYSNRTTDCENQIIKRSEQLIDEIDEAIKKLKEEDEETGYG